MGSCESLTINRFILSNKTPNLTLCWLLLATALRDLTLVFPEPLACLRLLWLLTFSTLASGESILAN
jgi:hypothetical protein